MSQNNNVFQIQESYNDFPDRVIFQQVEKRNYKSYKAWFYSDTDSLKMMWDEGGVDDDDSWYNPLGWIDAPNYHSDDVIGVAEKISLYDNGTYKIKKKCLITEMEDEKDTWFEDPEDLSNFIGFTKTRNPSEKTLRKMATDKGLLK